MRDQWYGAPLYPSAPTAPVERHVAPLVRYVDGEPFAVTDPDKPVLWPIKPGAHRFQLRLPAQDAPSAAVHVVVE